MFRLLVVIIIWFSQHPAHLTSSSLKNEQKEERFKDELNLLRMCHMQISNERWEDVRITWSNGKLFILRNECYLPDDDSDVDWFPAIRHQKRRCTWISWLVNKRYISSCLLFTSTSVNRSSIMRNDGNRISADNFLQKQKSKSSLIYYWLSRGKRLPFISCPNSILLISSLSIIIEKRFSYKFPADKRYLAFKMSSWVLPCPSDAWFKRWRGSRWW